MNNVFDLLQAWLLESGRQEKPSQPTTETAQAATHAKGEKISQPRKVIPND